MNLPQGPELKHSKFTMRLRHTVVAFSAHCWKFSGKFSEIMLNLTIDFAVGKVIMNIQYMVVLF